MVRFKGAHFVKDIRGGSNHALDEQDVEALQATHNNTQ
jgi:hypothetical protein